MIVFFVSLSRTGGKFWPSCQGAWQAHRAMLSIAGTYCACLPVSPNLPVPPLVHGLILEPAHTYLYSTSVDKALKPDKCLRTGSRVCLIFGAFGQSLRVTRVCAQFPRHIFS